MRLINIEGIKFKIKRLLFSIILSFFIGSICVFVFCPHCFIYGTHSGLPPVFRYYILTFFLIWEFSIYASNKLNNAIIAGGLTYKDIVKRIIYAVLIFIPISLIYIIFRFKLVAPDTEVWGPFDILVFELIVLGQFITCFLFLNWKKFYDSWEKKIKETEIIQKQKLEFELKALKNQINPHFLFNSLNTLTNLVHKDSHLAEKFINQLAKVYRYILEQKSNNLIRIENELRILSSYQFLMDIRFGDKILINIDHDNVKGFYVAPLVLQILIENALST